MQCSSLALLREDERYTIECYASSVRRAAVERNIDVVLIDVARSKEAACNEAMFDELQRWLTLQSFERVPNQLANDVVDPR